MPGRNGDGGRPPAATILYVAGFGRSGSTLLGRVFGQAPGAMCVGETCYLAVRGLVENVECGCGRPFRECAFWSRVGVAAFGGWDQVDVDRLIAADARTSRYRTLPRQPPGSAAAELSAAEFYYIAWLSRLFDAIARVSGTEVIVETSKDPWFAGLLARMPGRDIRIVHLVRDSRAVAYSWTRSKRKPSRVGEEVYMPKFRPVDAALRWTIANLSFHGLATRATAYSRVGYEEFIRCPHETLDRIGVEIGRELDLPSSELTDDQVLLSDHHIFSGNPMRTSTGWLEMMIDDEWQNKLGRRDFRQVTSVTWPLLRLYGYPLSPTSRRVLASA